MRRVLHFLKLRNLQGKFGLSAGMAGINELRHRRIVLTYKVLPRDSHTDMPMLKRLVNILLHNDTKN